MNDETRPLSGSPRQSPAASKTGGHHSRPCCCPRLCLIVSLSLILLVVAVPLLTPPLAGYPWHASCRVTWTFGGECGAVQERLIAQMNKWTGREGCKNGGMKCLYQYVGSNSSYLVGTHTTPKFDYVDDIAMQFEQSATAYTSRPSLSASDSICSVTGFSSSRAWYAVLDFGTNYCNMKNLVLGSQLDINDSKYSETTSNSVCTQYSSADCEKY